MCVFPNSSSADTHRLCRSARANVTCRRAATTTNTLTYSITYSWVTHIRNSLVHIIRHCSTGCARAQVGENPSLYIRLAHFLKNSHYTPKNAAAKRRYLHCIKEMHCASLPGSRYTHTSFVQSKFCCTSLAKSNGISTASSPTSPLSCNCGEKHSPFKPHCRAKADDAPEFRSTPFAHHVPPAALQPQNK